MAEALDVARARYGDRFAEVLAGSRVWLNGEPADPSAPVTDADEVAVLPPVSGGAVATAHGLGEHGHWLPALTQNGGENGAAA